MGRHTKHGGYVIDWKKVRTYVVPSNLADFTVRASTSSLPAGKLIGEQLSPFVSRKMRPTRGRFEGDPKGALSGALYLSRWKRENGED